MLDYCYHSIICFLISSSSFLFTSPPPKQPCVCLSFWHVTFSYHKNWNWWWLSTILQRGHQVINTVASVCTHLLWMSQFVAGSALLGICIQFNLALSDPLWCFIWLKCNNPDICRQILKHPGILFLLRKFKSCKLKLPKLSKIMNT